MIREMKIEKMKIEKMNYRRRKSSEWKRKPASTLPWEAVSFGC